MELFFGLDYNFEKMTGEHLLVFLSWAHKMLGVGYNHVRTSSASCLDPLFLHSLLAFLQGVSAVSPPLKAELVLYFYGLIVFFECFCHYTYYCNEKMYVLVNSS